MGKRKIEIARFLQVRMKKVLIISPQFVPVNSADSHRVRQMLPYLAENGWSAEIAAVNLSCLEKPVIDRLNNQFLALKANVYSALSLIGESKEDLAEFAEGFFA